LQVSAQVRIFDHFRSKNSFWDFFSGVDPEKNRFLKIMKISGFFRTPKIDPFSKVGRKMSEKKGDGIDPGKNTKI